jgi:GT2 family glycosyltransferase
LPVAVLLVNYHVHDELDRALSSLGPFLRAGDEIVVVDQESDADRLDRVRARHPRAMFVPTSTNVGFAAGVNLAARRSTAPFLMLLNPDAVIDEAVIDELERYLVDHPRAGVVGPRVLNEDGTIQPSARRFPGVSTAFGGRSSWLTRRFPENWMSRWNLPARQSSAPAAVDWLAGSCFMTRRSLFDALDGFDESFFLYWEDADYCRRAAAAGWERIYLPTVSVRHAGGRSAASNPASSIRAFHASAYRLYAKHAGSFGRVVAPFARLALWARAEWLVRRLKRAKGKKQKAKGR